MSGAHFNAVIVAVGYLASFIVIVRLVLQRREPTATLAWALWIILVPYVGVLAYLVLGRRRLKRHVKRRHRRANRIARHLAQLREGVEEHLAEGEPPHPTASPEMRGLVRLTARTGARLPTRGNDVQLYVNADGAYLALERAIARAKHHVHFEFYIFEPDETGRHFRDLLASKAREGVQVRVLTDGVGSQGLDDFMIPLQQAGGRWAEFMPLSLFGRHSHRANYRNHRKIAVIDGAVGFTGGVNIGDEYTGRKKRVGPWRDTHLRIRGPAVHHLQEVFAEDWHYATDEDAIEETWFPDQDAVGREIVQVVASGPDTATEPIHRIFFTVLTLARQRAWLTTPYFVPDQAMLVALQTAALRGVDVRLLLPRRSDMRLVLHAGRSYYDELLRSGVRIYEYLHGILHAKTMVVDDSWATVGSANMDVRSFRLNFEINAAIYGPEFANALGKVFVRDLRSAEEVTAAHLRERRPERRLVESFARLLSPVL